MSIDDQDPFQRIVSYEEATPDRLEILERLALDLVKQEPAERTMTCGQVLVETGATVSFTQTFYDDDPAITNSFAGVQFFRQGTNESDGITLVYNHNGDLTDLHCYSVEEANDALKVLQEIVENGDLGEEEILVARHVEEILFAFCFDGEIASEEGFVDIEIPVPEVIRKITNERCGDRAIITREFGAGIGKTDSIGILHREVVGDDEVDPSDINVKKLLIFYEDRTCNLSYEYTVGFDGVRSLQVMRGDEEYEYYDNVHDDLLEEADDDNLEKIVAEATKELKNNSPSKVDVETLIDRIITVTADQLDPSDLQ